VKNKSKKQEGRDTYTKLKGTYIYLEHNSGDAAYQLAYHNTGDIAGLKPDPVSVLHDGLLKVSLNR
jgi:hypothetical protein